MTPNQEAEVLRLWDAGLTLGQIVAETGLGLHSLTPIILPLAAKIAEQERNNMMKKQFDRQAPIAHEALPYYVSAVKFGSSHIHLMGATVRDRTLCGITPKRSVTQVAATVTCKVCCAAFRDGAKT